MSLFNAILVGLAMGIVFGFALEKSRVFEPAAIVGQMRLRNFIMLKIFLSAVITGLLVLAALHTGWGIKMHPKATLLAADLVGGLLLGAGIAIAGACPGTVLAQLGAGYPDARFTFAGGLAGALAFVYLEPTLRPFIKLADHGKLTLDAVIGMPFWVAAITFAGLLVIVVIGLEKWRPWRRELGVDFDAATAEVMAPVTHGQPPVAPAKA